MRDVQLLRDLEFRESSISTYTICCTFLKRGAKRGLTLKELGEMLVRSPSRDYTDAFGPLSTPTPLEETANRPSTVERLVSQAAEMVQARREEIEYEGTGIPSSATPSHGRQFAEEELSAFVELLEQYLEAWANGQPAGLESVSK